MLQNWSYSFIKFYGKILYNILYISRGDALDSYNMENVLYREIIKSNNLSILQNWGVFVFKFNRKIELLGSMIMCLLFLSSCSNAENIAISNISVNKTSVLSKAFTAGVHSVSIMEISLPSEDAKRLNDLSQKLKNSVQKNQQWFNDYVSKYSNTGENLPWDEKFGISKQEYDELLTSVDKMRLVEKMKTTVTISQAEDGKLVIGTNKDIPYLSGIKIDTLNNYIESASGKFIYGSNIEASDEQTATGRWSGATWKLNFEELKDANSIDAAKTYGTINISVGELEKTKKSMVYYKERVIKQGKSFKGEEIIIFND